MKDLIKNAKYPNKLLKGIDDKTLKEVKEKLNGEKLYALCLRLENICNYNCIYCGTYENRCKDGKIHGELHYNKKREKEQNSIRVIVIRR